MSAPAHIQQLLARNAEYAGKLKEFVEKSGDPDFIKSQIASLVKTSTNGEFYSKGDVGLENMGNSCYMNAVLQCLRHTHPLNTYILGSRIASVLKRNNETGKIDKIGNKTLLLINYIRIVQTAWEHDNSVLTPLSFKALIGSINELFAGFQQHDAHDFLVNLMNNFHEALSRNVQYRISGEIITELDRQITHAHEDWSRHYKDRHSVVLDIFSGQFQTQMTCDVCRQVKYRYDPFMNIDLPIPDGEEKKDADHITLEKCFESYIKPEQLVDSDRLECEKCQIKTKTHKVSTIWTLPNILIVKLNRFKYIVDKGRFISKKINTFVSYKTNEFDLAQYVTSPLNDSTTYDLYSIVCHIGDAGSGHYYSLCQNPISGKWLCYNDSRISAIDNPMSIITNHAYILFYRRRD